MNTANIQEIVLLTLKHLRGELSEPEKQQLTDWRAASAANESFFHSMTAEESLLSAVKEYATVAEFIEKKQAAPATGKLVRLPSRTLKRWAIAASILLLVSTSAYFFFTSSEKPDPFAGNTSQTEQPTVVVPGSNKAILTLADNTQVVLDDQTGTIAQQGSSRVKADKGALTYEAANATNGRPTQGSYNTYNTVTTPRGGNTYRIVLSDGSVIHLNTESSLKYPTVFNNDERIVELTGEAYFEVAKKQFPGSSSRLPFIVKTATQSIAVHGTKFDVNDYRDQEGATISTLLEGSVSVIVGDTKTMLRPGERSILNNQSYQLSVEPTQATDAIQWVHGAFSFNQTPILQAMKAISRWYDVSYEFDKNIPADKLIKAKLSGSIERNIPLDALLKNLANVVGNNLQLSLQGKTIHIAISR
jgi:ferric-dicitrate binding protein FerR (iron transport regulator)